jgi:hypothetical protein
MSLHPDDEFLDLIVRQARVAYATQQVKAYQKELECRQAHAIGEDDHQQSRGQQELLYYIQQVGHWQDYLMRLEQDISAGSAPALNILLGG